MKVALAPGTQLKACWCGSLYVATGKFGPVQLPKTPGGDFAGTVVEGGSKVGIHGRLLLCQAHMINTPIMLQFKAGDAVVALTLKYGPHTAAGATKLGLLLPLVPPRMWLCQRAGLLMRPGICL